MGLASPLTSYSDATPQKRQITDVISLISPSDAVVVERLGGLDGASGKFQFVNGPHTKMEWLEDTLPALATTLDGSIASGDVTITVADGSFIQEGHVLALGTVPEYVWVSAVAAEVITVTRAHAGTALSLATAGAVEIVGMQRLEGDDSDDVDFTDRTAPYNYTQIFQGEVKVSRTQRQLAQYGIDDEFEYQANKVVPGLMRLVNKTAYHGIRKTGSATTPRGAGGFSTFITDNTVSAGGAIVQADFEDALEAAYNDGGSGPWDAFCSPANMQVIKNFYDSSSYLRVDRGETSVGMVIETIVTPFGIVNLVMDRHAPNNKVWIVDPKLAGYYTYYPFTMEMLAKTGDSDKGEVVAELSFCVKQDKAHAAITAIS